MDNQSRFSSIFGSANNGLSMSLPLSEDGSMRLSFWELEPDFRLYEASVSKFFRYKFSFIKYTRPKPIKKTPKQNPIPPAVCPLDSPWTIILKKRPRKNPNRFPIANRSPVAEP